MFRLSQRTRMPAIFMALSALVIVVGAYFSVTLVITPMKQAKRAKAWPEVSCEVVKAEMKEQTYSSEESNLKSVLYSPHIEYSYEVNGKTYTNDLYSYATPSSTDHKRIRSIVNDYRLAKEVTCYVNPEDPQESVLSAKYKAGFMTIIPFMTLAAGCMGFLFALLLFIRGALDT